MMSLYRMECQDCHNQFGGSVETLWASGYQCFICDSLDIVIEQWEFVDDGLDDNEEESLLGVYGTK